VGLHLPFIYILRMMSGFTQIPDRLQSLFSPL